MIWRYVVARQDPSARWEFLDAGHTWVDEVRRAHQYSELSQAAHDARRFGGDAFEWRWAMQVADVPPEFAG